MKVHKTPLEGLLVIEPDVFKDERGFFLETYQNSRYEKIGLNDQFIQGNHSRSTRGVLRGMHYQVKKPQSQIVTIFCGCVYYVCVDVRKKSPTFGSWHGVELNEKGIMQLYMAPGFAGGFCVLSEVADLHYNVSELYDHHDEGGLLWNDPDIGIKWPFPLPKLNQRDSSFPCLKDILSNRLPQSSN